MLFHGSHPVFAGRVSEPSSFREVFRLQMLRHLGELLACPRVQMRQALAEVRQLGGGEISTDLSF